MKAPALALGILIGAALTGSASADVDLTDLTNRVQQLETNQACMTVSPVAIAQEHGSRKRILVVTTAGPDALAHPSRFVWISTVKPSCIAEMAK